MKKEKIERNKGKRDVKIIKKKRYEEDFIRQIKEGKTI